MIESAQTYSDQRLGIRAKIAAKVRRGPHSLFNLSIYSFGTSGIWTGFGSIILPFKVIEILESETVAIFGWELGKTGLLALISLSGLVVVAIVQPIAGSMSDRAKRLSNSHSKRLPFVIFGLFGLSAMTLTVGFADTFLMLFLITIAMQVLGNTAQGPANALIIDHVDENQRGHASGVLNLMRLAGAGVVSMMVVTLMRNYDSMDAPEWIWYSALLMAAVSAGTTTYTLLALRLYPERARHSDEELPPLPKREPVIRSVSSSDDSAGTAGKVSPLVFSRSRFAMFLVALAFAVAAMSSVQTNALFFLQDALGIENPTRGGDVIIVALIGSSAAVVYPAGKLSDRFGRGNFLMVAGLIGAAGVLALIFVSSLIQTILPAMLIGVSVGIYLSVGWAVANDLVKRATAARDLGLTSISSLAGSIIGKSSGFGIGILNRQSESTGIENLGYDVMLITAGAAFIVSGFMFWRVVNRNQSE